MRLVSRTFSPTNVRRSLVIRCLIQVLIVSEYNGFSDSGCLSRQSSFKKGSVGSSLAPLGEEASRYFDRAIRGVGRVR
ncbi:hypothetical protein MNBD_GAMMA12-2261 [hydrothermal vent metagenome]|uniref:Uncharacterized protein n=1 Tax=hydrothermal vent metagenome TaxID=652676 RepID=A0A3B0YLY7_9ZZZZ